jgi:hypothetical protein
MDGFDGCHVVDGIHQFTVFLPAVEKDGQALPKTRVLA